MLRGVAGAAWLALSLAPAPASAGAVAEFPRGSWSVGAQGAYAILRMEDVNTVLRQVESSTGARYDDLRRGWEGSLDVRYAFRDGFFVGLEGGYLRGRVTDETGTRGPVEVAGVPLQLIGGGAIGGPSDLVVRVVAGLGVLAGGTLTDQGRETASGTGFLTSLGGELEFRLAPTVALTAQALARQAKVMTPGELDYDLDFTGGSFRVGVRGYFGAAGGER